MDERRRRAEEHLRAVRARIRKVMDRGERVTEALRAQLQQAHKDALSERRRERDE